MSSTADSDMTSASFDEENERLTTSAERPTPAIDNTNDCKAVVKYNKPQSTRWHGLMVSGRLLTQFGGVLFYPDGPPRRWIEFAFFDEEVPELPTLDEEDIYMNHSARRFLIYAKSSIPRILFRGFSPESGGGHPWLNGRHGIIPHGFLNGKSMANMWNNPELAEMIEDHIAYNKDMLSDFSSWSQKFGMALDFSSYLNYPEEATIAVLDTTPIAGRIWHTVDLKRAKMSQYEYYQEYLIYGLVHGPTYHCVSASELCENTKIRELMWGPRFEFGEDPGSCAIERGAVQSAMEVATFLQPEDAPVNVENLAILTARFVSYRADQLCNWCPREVMSYVDMDTYLYYARDHVQFFAMNTEDGEVSLIDDTVFIGRQCLKFELHLLQAVENAVRVMAYEVRVAMWGIYRPFDMNVDWPLYVMDRTQLETGDERVDATISFLFRLAEASKGGIGAVHEK